jgi:predicted Zn-dependent protease
VAPAQPPAYQQRPAMPMQPPMPGYRDPRMQPPAGYGRPPQTAMQTPAPADTTTGTATEQPPVMQARQAYWNRQFDKAEEQYQALAKSEPENPDPHGELGNLYYSQGRWQDAADSYYEAATRLLDKGHTSRAMYLQQIIAGLDRAKADKLAKQIAEARQPAPVNQ